jgi:hypothetical protein
MKIAEGLLLRKQLALKVEQLKPLKDLGERGVFDQQVKRVNVSENVDQLTIVTPRVSLEDITLTFDHYATQLRKLDAALQKANWTHDLDFKEEKAPEPKAPEDITRGIAKTGNPEGINQ